MSARSQMKGKRIGVIMGGPSSEREVSLKTGKGVLEALLSRGYDAVGIDWKAGESLPAALTGAGVQVAFNALHGVWGEDGCVQGLLECMGIPYTGSGVMGSAVAMDKVMTKRIFDRMGVPSATWRVVPGATVGEAGIGRGEEWARGVIDTDEAVAAVGYPMVVKPSREGSSVGVTIVHEAGALDAALAEARKYHGDVILEEYVAGREIQVAVLEGEVLGDVEVRPAKEFYDYEAKYLRNDTQYLCPAPVSEEEHARMAQIAIRAHEALGCTGYSRVDLILGRDGRVVCLEVNTLPGLTEKSLVPKIAAAAGVDYGTLCERILAGAELKA